MSTHPTVEAYLAACDEPGRTRLLAIRDVVRDVAPDAVERISYDIPTFDLDGSPLVYMAAWKQHVSLYPLPSGDAALASLLAPHVVAKGTVKFRHRDPLPLDVVRAVVQARRAELEA
ncbi:MAG: DUF1801 domain-containing protein [Ilumatobacteraceae bacterium]